jgi:hypothetical protein
MLTSGMAGHQEPLSPSSPTERALAANRGTLWRLEQRAAKTGVLLPTLSAYKANTARPTNATALLHNLTGALLAAFDETRQMIEDRMSARYPEDEIAAGRAVTNSLRRSAGTNYQSLVTFAIASYLVAVESAWAVAHPVPKEFLSALVINFDAVAATSNDAQDAPGNGQGIRDPEPDPTEPVSVREKGEEALNEAFVIQPDVDIALRNLAWSPQDGSSEPILLLSAKTSLVDRAGQAARWKLYFDLASNPCPCEDCEGCVYKKLGISMKNADAYDIEHGIVTANIYKYWFRDKRYRKGELASAQTRSNTGMFDLRLTTREDEEAETPPGWRHLDVLPDIIGKLSKKHGLPI